MSRVEDIKQGRAEALLSLDDTRFIRFKGACLVSAPGTYGYTPLGGEMFSELVYNKFGKGIAKGSISDLQHVVSAVAPDLSGNARYIAFGEEVWDSRTLRFLDDPLSVTPVYSSRIAINRDPANIAKVEAYFLSLADGSATLAKDYPQMMAPLFMDKRPLGVIWALGGGANGKSAFLEALDPILGKHFSHLTMEMIEDGRATPSLRGVLGNIVSETSEKRVEDMQKYKNMGAHEPFDVRVLGTHDVVSIDTNFHCVFSANNIPAFGDKSMGSRRRTLLVPFPAQFEQDMTFNERTFTKEFLGAMLYIFLQATHGISKHGYRWSPESIALQGKYNQDSNTAEAFARHLDEMGIVAFKNYNLLKMHYEAWCAEVGTVSLGRTQLTRAIETVIKPVLKVYRNEDNLTIKRYFASGTEPTDVIWYDNGYATAKLTKHELAKQLQLSGENVNEW